MTTDITIVGNLTGDPELRFTPSGAAVCNFTVAVNERIKDQATNEWKDGDATFYNCAAWREMAENVAESLQSGMRVVVKGGLKGRSFERQDGSKGLSIDVTVDSVGADLRWATAKVTRTARNGGQQGGGQQGGGQQGGGSWGNQGGSQPQGAPANDPWASPGAGGTQPQGAPANDPWASPSAGGDEPPF